MVLRFLYLQAFSTRQASSDVTVDEPISSITTIELLDNPLVLKLNYVWCTEILLAC